MELSDMGEHVFAAQRILKQRIRKVLFFRLILITGLAGAWKICYN